MIKIGDRVSHPEYGICTVINKNVNRLTINTGKIDIECLECDVKCFICD